MLNLTLEEAKKSHKEMWTMISDVLREHSINELDEMFCNVVLKIKNYCLDKMSYGDVKPDVSCFLCDYASEHNDMCPYLGLCNGYIDECLGGLYLEFTELFDCGLYISASIKALEIANLELNALDKEVTK